jgi:hypothetical protein
VKKVHVDKDQVEITLTDKNHPTATDFERALTEELGEGVKVILKTLDVPGSK